MRIANNIMAMTTHRSYTRNNDRVQASAEKLSSGYKINRAGDDAAGLAISEKMRSQIRGLTMSTKNSQDAVSLIQTAEGALQEVHSMLQRMNELAVQSATGTNERFDRTQLAKEFEQLKREINDISEQTTFNNMKILDGSLSAKGLLRTAYTSGLYKTFDPVEHAFEKDSISGASVTNANNFVEGATRVSFEVSFSNTLIERGGRAEVTIAGYRYEINNEDNIRDMYETTRIDNNTTTHVYPAGVAAQEGIVENLERQIKQQGFEVRLKSGDIMTFSVARSGSKLVFTANERRNVSSADFGALGLTYSFGKLPTTRQITDAYRVEGVFGPRAIENIIGDESKHATISEGSFNFNPEMAAFGASFKIGDRLFIFEDQSTYSKTIQTRLEEIERQHLAGGASNTVTRIHIDSNTTSYDVANAINVAFGEARRDLESIAANGTPGYTYNDLKKAYDAALKEYNEAKADFEAKTLAFTTASNELNRADSDVTGAQAWEDECERWEQTCLDSKNTAHTIMLASNTARDDYKTNYYELAVSALNTASNNKESAKVTATNAYQAWQATIAAESAKAVVDKITAYSNVNAAVNIATNAYDAMVKVEKYNKINAAVKAATNAADAEKKVKQYNDIKGAIDAASNAYDTREALNDAKSKLSDWISNSNASDSNTYWDAYTNALSAAQSALNTYYGGSTNTTLDSTNLNATYGIMDGEYGTKFNAAKNAITGTSLSAAGITDINGLQRTKTQALDAATNAVAACSGTVSTGWESANWASIASTALSSATTAVSNNMGGRQETTLNGITNALASATTEAQNAAKAYNKTEMAGWATYDWDDTYKKKFNAATTAIAAAGLDITAVTDVDSLKLKKEEAKTNAQRAYNDYGKTGAFSLFNMETTYKGLKTTADSNVRAYNSALLGATAATLADKFTLESGNFATASQNYSTVKADYDAKEATYKGLLAAATNATNDYNKKLATYSNAITAHSNAINISDLADAVQPKAEAIKLAASNAYDAALARFTAASGAWFGDFPPDTTTRAATNPGIKKLFEESNAKAAYDAAYDERKMRLAEEVRASVGSNGAIKLKYTGNAGSVFNSDTPSATGVSSLDNFGEWGDRFVAVDTFASFDKRDIGEVSFEIDLTKLKVGDKVSWEWAKDVVSTYTYQKDDTVADIIKGLRIADDNGVIIDGNTWKVLMEEKKLGGSRLQFEAAHDYKAGTYDAMKIQVGALEGEQLSIKIGAINTKGLELDDESIYTQEEAGSAVTATRAAINKVSDQRALLGAMQNRMSHKIANLKVSVENLQASESRIRDVDIASEMTAFTKNNILAQAATSMLAQANSNPQNVLTLLR